MRPLTDAISGSRGDRWPRETRKEEVEREMTIGRRSNSNGRRGEMDDDAAAALIVVLCFASFPG